MDINAFLLARRTGSMEKGEALADWRGSGLFSGKEKAVSEYVEAITGTERQVDDPLLARLRRHFNDDAVVALTELVAFQNLSSKFNGAVDLPAQGVCSRPPARGWAPAEDLELRLPHPRNGGRRLAP